MIRRLKRRLGIRFSTKALKRNPGVYLRQLLRRHRSFPDLVAGLAATRPVAIVQVGANDGSSNDPLGEMILHRPERVSRALLIEPQQSAFKRLAARYAKAPHVTCLNAAIDREPGERAIYSMDMAAASERLGRRISDGLASFSRPHLENAFRNADPAISDAELDQLITETPVPVTTIRQAMETAGMRDADVLLVDTEGFDAEIMAMALEAGLRPALLQFEHAHLDAATRRALAGRLRREGYRLWASHLDMWGQRVGTGTSPR
ncbi:MAG: hypothetical protein TEF_17430 [Rhizobiales bacterium NRL2]|jgi:FkbM family methyltransferase|nr:MAG: hypothetical protein TEF_17430 [Rhizobiales bacterium NRL2]